MDKPENLYHEEYRMIRAEIVNCISLQNSLSTFMITAVTALLALAFTQMNPWLFLLPYVVILPIGCGIFHYRGNVLKLATYLIVFLEPNMKGMNWETRHAEYVKGEDRDRLFVFRNYLSMFLSGTVYLLFLYSYFSVVDSVDTISILAVISPLLPTGYMIYLTWITNKSLTRRSNYIEQWKNVKSAEEKE